MRAGRYSGQPAAPGARGGSPPLTPRRRCRDGGSRRRPWIRRSGVLLAAGLALCALCSRAPAADAPERAPRDPVQVIRNMEDPARDAVMKPDEVVAALGLRPGQVIGDIGAGTGYFARRFAKRVGPAGRVFAVDIQPLFLEELQRRAAEEGIGNIVPILAQPSDSLLAEDSCDLLFLHNVYIYLPDRVAYLKHLKARLKPGGRVAIVGWRRDVILPGPRQAAPRPRSLTLEEVAGELGAAGFSVVETVDYSPERYFLVGVPRE